MPAREEGQEQNPLSGLEQEAHCEGETASREVGEWTIAEKREWSAVAKDAKRSRMMRAGITHRIL